MACQRDLVVFFRPEKSSQRLILALVMKRFLVKKGSVEE